MFHVELRQFPHNHSRFNLSDGELVALVDPWVREQWVELGERKWNCNQATMTILEGPQLPVQKLSMGRGWRTAQRESEDVTERVMSAARGAMNGQADLVSLGSLLGAEAPRLLEAWRSAVAAAPDLAPSESLALAERRLSAANTSEA